MLDIEIPLIALIFQGIPEQIGVSLLAFIIANLKIDWKKIISCGILLAISTFIIRSLPLMFGIHTIFLMIALFLFLRFVGRAEISNSMIACLVSIAAIIVLEVVCLNILIPLFNINAADLLNDPWQRVLLTLPQVVLIYALSFIIYKLRKRGLVNEF